MASQRKNETREEYLERVRVISQNQRDNKTSKQLLRDRELARLRSVKRRANYTLEDKRRVTEQERVRRNKHFTVYTHTLGDKMYIGSGNSARPIDFTHRKGNWYKAFNTIPDVEVVANIKTRDLSLVLEQFLINIHGMNNLVNKQRACSIKDNLKGYLELKRM